MKKILLLVTFIGLSVSGFAHTIDEAARVKTFHTNLNTAYADYRHALFQTNKNNQPLSLKAAQSFQKLWEDLMTEYSTQPPAAYGQDLEWDVSTQKIGQILGMGIQQIEQNSLAEAHETLEKIRDILSDLRQRNNVVVFSDYVNEYHAKMESVLEHGFTIASLKKGEINLVREQLAVLEYLAQSLRHHAPLEYTNDKKFNQLLSKNEMVIKALRNSIATESYPEIIKNIKALKPAYAKLFINFG